jgi:hypothetical protein
LLLAALAGCGGDRINPVEGKIVWEDGSPATELAGSHVIFDLPEKQTSARGIVQEDGTFRLTTNKPDDGALAGDYKVLVVEANRKPLGGPDPTELAPGVVDSRYASPATSDLRTTVERGRNQITLIVKRAPRR